MRIIQWIFIVIPLIVLTNQEEETTNSLPYPIIDRGEYKNPWNAQRNSTSIVKFFFSKDNTNLPKDEKKLDQTLPVHFITDEEINEFCDTNSGGKIKVIWIGHSSCLINFENKIILMDPIFSQRASPVSFMGPKRYRPIPIEVKRIPRVDIVLISHNHYDHLDEVTIADLNDKFGKSITWLVPLGLVKWFKDEHIEKNVFELNWWESIKIHDFEIVFTAAQHWSGRGLFDRYETLWGGWIVIGKEKRIYYTGDTGICPVFAQIGKKYGPFDLSFIPIGAYEPRPFMNVNHCDPEEAVTIHNDIKSLQSVAVHWGTFKLGREFYLGPRIELDDAVRKATGQNKNFKTMNHGEINFF